MHRDRQAFGDILGSLIVNLGAWENRKGSVSYMTVETALKDPIRLKPASEVHYLPRLWPSSYDHKSTIVRPPEQRCREAFLTLDERCVKVQNGALSRCCWGNIAMTPSDPEVNCRRWIHASALILVRVMRPRDTIRWYIPSWNQSKPRGKDSRWWHRPHWTFKQWQRKKNATVVGKSGRRGDVLIKVEDMMRQTMLDQNEDLTTKSIILVYVRFCSSWERRVLPTYIDSQALTKRSYKMQFSCMSWQAENLNDRSKGWKQKGKEGSRSREEINLWQVRDNYCDTDVSRDRKTFAQLGNHLPELRNNISVLPYPLLMAASSQDNLEILEVSWRLSCVTIS